MKKAHCKIQNNILMIDIIMKANMYTQHLPFEKEGLRAWVKVA